MKIHIKNLSVIILLVLTFLVIFVPLTYNFYNNTNNDPYHIAFIRLKEGGQFWSTMRNGARTARTETGCIVDFYSGVMASDVSSQCEFVEEAIKNSVDCIIITPCNSVLMEEPLKKAAKANIKVIQLLNETTRKDNTFTNTIIHSYMTNAKIVGISLAQSLLTENRSQNLNVVIVGSSEYISSEKQMEEGIRETLSKESSITTDSMYVGYDSIKIKEKVKLYLQKNKHTNMIIALNNDTSEAILNILKQTNKNHDIQFIAYSHSLTNIESLETGIVDKILVVNSFAMGYQAIYAAIDLLNNVPITNAPIDYAIVTKENMFNPKIQRKLFPLI
ncbi:MAG: hypothetical protein BKP49_05875 [Treponema sp. CETP13]|nr:MAG: hypothetical protein BKP49_05875 [Treponema sp. CETP13]